MSVMMVSVYSEESLALCLEPFCILPLFDDDRQCGAVPLPGRLQAIGSWSSGVRDL